MKNFITSLQCEVKSFIKQNALLKQGDKVLLAVSGGADSVAMLHILYNLRVYFDISLCVAHFDHGTRNGASTEEGLLVADYCRRFNLKFIGGQAAPDSFNNGNFENEARKLRYAFLRQAATAQGANVIATAHHRDDLAETVLLHLLRGCGTEGIAAIAPKENDIIRPLLILSRENIELYCKSVGLIYAMDSSNADTRYLRNKLRLQLLPQLREINPNLNESLANTAAICREENELLEELSQTACLACIVSEKIDFLKLTSLQLALQRRVLRRLCEQRTAQLPSFKQTEAMLALKEGAFVALNEGKTAFLRNNELLFIDNQQIISVIKDSQPVNSEFKLGSYDLGNDYFCVAQLLPFTAEENVWVLWLDSSLAFTLSWRNRRESDKITSKGMSGHKTVKSIMNEAHLNKEERENLPLLLCSDEILWVPGLRKALLGELIPTEIALRIEICRK